MKVRSNMLWGRFLTTVSSIALEAMLSISKVVPSGLAVITSVTAGTVLPPGLFTTLTGTFQRVSSTWAMTRALESVEAPAANGTMISIGLLGYLTCAIVLPGFRQVSAVVTKIRSRRMNPSVALSVQSRFAASSIFIG